MNTNDTTIARDFERPNFQSDAVFEYQELRGLVSVLGDGAAQRAAENYLLTPYVDYLAGERR